MQSIDFQITRKILVEIFALWHILVKACFFQNELRTFRGRSRNVSYAPRFVRATMNQGLHLQHPHTTPGPRGRNSLRGPSSSPRGTGNL
jgi:hypothetical protein